MGQIVFLENNASMVFPSVITEFVYVRASEATLTYEEVVSASHPVSATGSGTTTNALGTDWSQLGWSSTSQCNNLLPVVASPISVRPRGTL